MRALNVILAVLISLLLAVLVFEGGLRLFPAYRPQATLNRFDETLGWSKRSNAVVRRKTHEFDVEFEVNELGLRDDPMSSPAKPANTHRVLFLGDSFVLGYTVDREHLFVDHLERWWTAEKRRVDVINAGTEGYSTDQQALWFLERGLEYQPDLVLLFPYENDIYWNGQTSYTRFPKPRFEPDGRPEARALVDPGPSPAINRWALGLFANRAIRPLLNPPQGPPPHHFQPEGSDLWLYSEFAPLLLQEPPFLADAVARTRGALMALRDACAESGARLMVVPIPSESAVHAEAREKFRTQRHGLRGLADDAWSPDRPVNLFLALARELGIETLDARSALRARAEQGPLYFDDEWHFNERGNQVFATYLHDELENLGVFPEEHGALVRAPLEVPQPEGGVPGFAKLFLLLWVVLGGSYAATYRDETSWLAFLKVGVLLAAVFTIVLGGGALLALEPRVAPVLLAGFVVLVLGFVAWKLGRRLGTILELLKAFTLRGHWYLMPLVVVLLTIGSLLVVAASSPLIAPFIYTLF